MCLQTNLAAASSNTQVSTSWSEEETTMMIRKKSENKRKYNRVTFNKVVSIINNNNNNNNNMDYSKEDIKCMWYKKSELKRFVLQAKKQILEKYYQQQQQQQQHYPTTYDTMEGWNNNNNNNNNNNKDKDDTTDIGKEEEEEEEDDFRGLERHYSMIRTEIKLISIRCIVIVYRLGFNEDIISQISKQYSSIHKEEAFLQGCNDYCNAYYPNLNYLIPTSPLLLQEFSSSIVPPSTSTSSLSLLNKRPLYDISSEEQEDLLFAQQRRVRMRMLT